MSGQKKNENESFWGSLAYQIRLFFRLLFDKRVSGLMKFIFVVIPVIYFLIPLPDDLAPAIGLLDDFIFLFIFALIFVALCPPDIKKEYKEKMLNKNFTTDIKAKRHPQENRELVKGFLIISLVICLGGYLAGIVGLALYLGTYLATRFQRLKLLANALEINDKHLPEVYKTFQEVAAIEPEAQIKLFVIQDPQMNAMVFGFHGIYSMILTSQLVEKMNPEEIRAVIGHELGHIYWGHIDLTNLLIGVFQGKLSFFFLRWQRYCEHSADAMSVYVSENNCQPAITALLKLSSGLADVEFDVQKFLEQQKILAEQKVDPLWLDFLETHPSILNRVNYILSLFSNLAIKA